MEENLKKNLRKEMQFVRNSIIDCEQKNLQIFEGVKNFVEKFLLKNIFSYVSMLSEVDTRAIISYYISKNGFNVYIPFTKTKMTIHRLLSADKLVPNNYGNILASQFESANYVGKIDLVLVPLLAFDKDLFRLGYGGGYYDRYLLDCNAFSLGLAFDEQEVDAIPRESHDVQLDGVITPTRLLINKGIDVLWKKNSEKLLDT